MLRASILLLLAGCGNGKKEDVCPATIEYQDPARPTVQGLDEALVTLDDAIRRGVTLDDAAVTLEMPADGATVAVADWTYAWSLPGEARNDRVSRPRERTWGDVGLEVLESFSFEGTAEAHGEPVTDDTFLLELFFPGEECPVRMITTAETWPVDEEARAKVTSETAVEAQLTWAFIDNQVVQEGPARATNRYRVTVTP